MFTSNSLTEHTIYTRNDLQQQFQIHDATLNNGVFQPKGYQSIWLFITEQKTNDRTSFKDLLDGDFLHWDGQTEGRTDKLIIEHERKGLELLVFYRKSRHEFPKSGFTYEGPFHYNSHSGSHPTHFVLQRVDTVLNIVEKDIEALKLEESYQEGKLVSMLINKHERNPNLRKAAMEIHGTRCQVCGFSFLETYGEYGKDFIEIHHLYPVSKYKGATNVDPVQDMAALCANCHRIIHRSPEKPLSTR